MDSRLPAFICVTMSSRSVLLMLLINSTYLKQPPQAVSRQATKPLCDTAREFCYYLLAYWLLGSFADKCNADCSSCTHCMDAKLIKKVRKRQDCLLNKVKMPFFLPCFCIKMQPSPFLFPNFCRLFVPKITCLATYEYWYVWESLSRIPSSLSV